MEKLNFNHIEKQHRCIARSFHTSQPPYNYKQVLLTYFIESRNYGWGTYKGVLYNLNLDWQVDQLLKILQSEGFISINQDTYSIHDSNYSGFTSIPKHQLLYHLAITKLNPLTKEECLFIDAIASK